MCIHKEIAMNAPRLFAAVAAVLIATLLGSTALYAAPASQPQIAMLSGGIGEEEVDRMNAAQEHYSLKLIYAEANGDYLTDVAVRIQDHKKNVVLETVASQGPIVLINLKPGTYTLVSTVSGKSSTQRIAVRGNGLSTYIIHLHSTES